MHEPVLLDVVMSLLPQGSVWSYVDCTVGQAGHAAMAITHGPVAVFGFDRDPVAIEQAALRLAAHNNVTLIQDSYEAAVGVIERCARLGQYPFVLMDLGLGTHQFEQSARGFSYQKQDEKLDMRFGPHDGEPAYRKLATNTASDIADNLRHLGGVKRPGKVATALSSAAIAGAQTVGQFLSSLADFDRQPAELSRIFQALRIWVNDELGRLRNFFDSLSELARRIGLRSRLAVISFHSDEDRSVKQAMRAWANDCTCPPSFPQCICDATALGALHSRKPIKPSDEEIARNVRARSAILRVFDFYPVENAA